MRQETLTVVKGGLNRLRTKGAALKDSLFELLNGYVTTEQTVVVRPGTALEDTLPAGTIGLVAFGGSRHVFAASVIGGIPAGYTLHVLRSPVDNTDTVARIHFAKPFLGVLYVAAEFASGLIYHFWLRESDIWVTDTGYKFNELVSPAVDNSFVYRATRASDGNIIWTEGAERALNDKVEPTVPNSFYFEVTQIFGANAISGLEEPDWADAVDGQVFAEYVDGTAPPPVSTPTAPPDDNVPPQDILDRYEARFPDGDRR